MEKLYFALVDTPGLFAFIIRKTIAIPYVHVVLSLDSFLEEAYSVGRRHPSIPLIAGFEQERLAQIFHAFPTARYRVFSIECTASQKEAIAQHLTQCYERRFHYHYCVLGLPFLLANRPFYQQRHFTCSSFIAWILAENGIDLFQKHFSLVTPRDFYELSETVVTFEGPLASFPGIQYNEPIAKKHLEKNYESKNLVKRLHFRCTHVSDLLHHTTWQ